MQTAVGQDTYTINAFPDFREGTPLSDMWTGKGKETWFGMGHQMATI